MRHVYPIVLAILLMTLLTSRVKGAANLEMTYVFIIPDKPKTYEPSLIEVVILNHEGSGQYYDLMLAQSMILDSGFGTGRFVEGDGHVAMVSGYANPAWETRVSFILSPIAAGRVKLSLSLRDVFANVVDTWEKTITIEKGDLEMRIDSGNCNLTSIQSSLSSLTSTVNLLNSRLNSYNSSLSSQKADLTVLQGSLDDLKNQLKTTQDTLTMTQIGLATAIIVVFGTFLGVFYYREKLKKWA